MAIWLGSHPHFTEQEFSNGLLGLLIPIAVVVVLAYAFGWLPQNNNQSFRQEKPKRSALTALDILEQRYARGEISRDEYLEMREDLSR